MSNRFEPLPRPDSSWSTGYRCLRPGCAYTTGFWPDDGSAEENIHTHLANAHPEENRP